MNGKTVFGIVLIALATAGGIVFINKRAKANEVIPTAEQVLTYGNSVNNPISINKANPGNIRDSLDVFQGEVDSPNSAFKSFSSMAYGFRAMIKIMQTYYNAYNLKTLSAMISRWAPAEDNNDPVAYTNFVAANGPFDPDADMYGVLYTGYNDDIKNILTCMTWMEQGLDFTVNENDIRSAFDLI